MNDNYRWQQEQQEQQEYEEMERALQTSGTLTEKGQTLWDSSQKTMGMEITNEYHQDRTWHDATA